MTRTQAEMARAVVALMLLAVTTLPAAWLADRLATSDTPTAQIGAQSGR